jgi:hypothetical protein
MKHSTLKRYVALLGLVVLLSGCADSPNNSASSNSNSAQQPNSNAQQPVAQGDPANPAPSVAVPTVQPIPPPAAAPVQPPVTANVNGAIPPKPAAKAGGPKLIAPSKRLEFGKQPQDKTLIRAIVIKNGGRANLNVESVTPS